MLCKYFRQKFQPNLMPQLDGVLVCANSDYRIPFEASVNVEADLSIVCANNHYVVVKQTIQQQEKGIGSWFVYENKTGKDQFLLIKPRISNTVRAEFANSPDKSLFIHKGDPIGIMTISPINDLALYCRVFNQNELFETAVESKQEIIEDVKLDTPVKPPTPFFYDRVPYTIPKTYTWD